ncbi:MAG TPA: PEP-CTERM sorting domain-containing protein [Steroidobacteraceae bacterium]|jgi:hypothetical protein|nr:PEP-CTERM sorting domain-containing protein [Steroidobacteraceae bacterium]
MNISKVVALSILGLGVANVASAKVYNVSDDASVSGSSKSGVFSDVFNFGVGKKGADLSFSWLFSTPSFLGVELYSVSKAGKLTGIDGLFTGNSGSFTDALSKGSYQLDFGGFSTTRSAFTVGIAPVPEAGTWMMLLIGGGMVGVQLRRKHKALPRQTLALS